MPKLSQTASTFLLPLQNIRSFITRVNSSTNRIIFHKFYGKHIFHELPMWKTEFNILNLWKMEFGVQVDDVTLRVSLRQLVFRGQLTH